MEVCVCVFSEDPKSGIQDWLQQVRTIRESQQSSDWEIDSETLNKNKPPVSKVIFRYGKRVILIGDFVNAVSFDEANNDVERSTIELENIQIQGEELKQFDQDAVMKVKGCGVVSIN